MSTPNTHTHSLRHRGDPDSWVPGAEPKSRAQVPGFHKSEEKAAKPHACTASYTPLSKHVHFCDRLPTQLHHCNSLQPFLAVCMILGRSPKPSELLTFCLQRGYSDIPRTEKKVGVAAAGLVDLGNPSPHGTLSYPFTSIPLFLH